MFVIVQDPEALKDVQLYARFSTIDKTSLASSERSICQIILVMNCKFNNESSSIHQAPPTKRIISKKVVEL